MNDQKKIMELEKQHKERLEKYNLEERKAAFDRLFGSLSILKDIDIDKSKTEAILK